MKEIVKSMGVLAKCTVVAVFAFSVSSSLLAEGNPLAEGVRLPQEANTETAETPSRGPISRSFLSAADSVNRSAVTRNRLGVAPDLRIDPSDRRPLTTQGSKSGLIFEGFEAGVPPAGWTTVVNNSFTWESSDLNAYEGVFAAACRWDSTLSGTQDEWLISPSLDLTTGGSSWWLDFWWAGSYYWAVDPHKNCMLSVLVSPDGGISWDTVWTHLDFGPYDDWAWNHAYVDLTEYLASDDFNMAFRYTGYDGAAFYLDAVFIDDVGEPMGRCCFGDPYAPTCSDMLRADCMALADVIGWYEGLTCTTDPCPPPPVNDSCVNAIDITGSYPVLVDGTTLGATLDCIDLGWDAVWYSFDLPDSINNVFIDFCGTQDDFSNISALLFTDCSCDSTSKIYYDNAGWYHCGDYRAPKLFWNNVPGPAKVYYAVWTGSQNQIDFHFSVDVSEPVYVFRDLPRFGEENSGWNFQVIDLDHDNEVDLLWSLLGDDPGIRLAYGDSTGFFEEPIPYLSNRQAAIDVGFVNADTLMDFVVRDHRNLYVFLNGNNREYVIDSIPISGSLMSVVTLGHFNEDPFLDLVTTPDLLYTGDGNGNFSLKSTLLPYMYGADVSDLNNDGIDDLIIIWGDWVSIYLNDGFANFTESATLWAGGSTRDVSTSSGLSDFDRDGNKDFAVVAPLGPLSDSVESMLTVVYGDGTGGVLYSDTMRVAGRSSFLTVLDANRDNHLDIALSVVEASARSRLEIYYGNESGGFTDSSSVDWQAKYCKAVASGDFDRDGNPDFVTASTVTVNSFVRLAYSLLPDLPILADEMRTTGYSNVMIEVINPAGFSISQPFETVAGADYLRFDTDLDGEIDERAMDYNLLYGEYAIIITPQPDAPVDGPVKMGIGLNGSQQRVAFNDYSFQRGGKGRGSYASGVDSLVFYFTVEDSSSILPENGKRTACAQPVFEWHRLVDTSTATRYHFQLDRDYFLDSLDQFLYNDSGLTTASFHISSPLGVDSVYYWRIRSHDGGGWSGWSRTFAAFIGDDIGCCSGDSMSCCTGPTMGNVDCTGIVDIGDVYVMIRNLFITLDCYCCQEEADMDYNGDIDIGDLMILINRLFISVTDPPPCP